LDRQQSGLATGEAFDLFFTPATSLTGATNTVTITFPNDAANNTKWCKTGAGTVTPTGELEPAGTTQVTGESAAAMIGTLTGACTQTPDTFTISAVGALQAAQKYGVRIVGGTSAIGTGDTANNIKVTIKTRQGGSVDTDTYIAATSLVAADQYTINAAVDPTLTVALTGTDLAFGTMTAANIYYQGITSTVTTNLKSGYVSLVSKTGTYTNGTDTIADAAGTIAQGTSGFGASTSMAAQTILVSNVAPSCTTSLQTTTGSYNASEVTTNAWKQFAGSTTPKSAEAATICFYTAISASQPPGTYTTSVTLVTTAKY
jgi:hypothetical protein